MNISHSEFNGRYANNSNYKNDTMIRKEAYSHQVENFSNIKIILMSGCHGRA